MPQKESSFLVNKQFFHKLGNQKKDVYVKVDLLNRIIESFRIRLIPFKFQDIENYYKLYSDKEVMCQYCNGNTRSEQEVTELMNNYIGDKEPSYFSILDKYTSSFIGTIFLTTKKQNEGEILLGYLINKDYWGNNYAKEALYSLMFCLFPLVRKDITVITATVKDDNSASKHILEQFNFKRIEEIEKFGQKRALYKLDVEEVRDMHKNIEMHKLSLVNKNLGTVFLTYAELLENASLYKYFLKNIIAPVFPYNIFSQIDELFSYLPKENSFWISVHFSLSSLSYILLSDQRYSFFTKFTLPAINTIGYSSKLFISEIYQTVSEERIKKIILNDSSDSTPSYFDNCFYEVTLATSLSLAFSLPAAFSLTSVGVPYSIFSTFSSLTSSAITCAASNKQIISPNNNSFSAKITPYLIDFAIAISTISSLSFCSFGSLSEISLNIKKASFIMSTIVSADQVTKAALEIVPNSFFVSIDSLLGFVYLNPQNEVSEGFDNFG